VKKCKPLVAGAPGQPHVRAVRGRAVQVDPMKPTLKPPGTERLTPKCETPLSDFAFKFYLRHYNAELRHLAETRIVLSGFSKQHLVGRCRLTLSNPR